MSSSVTFGHRAAPGMYAGGGAEPWDGASNCGNALLKKSPGSAGWCGPRAGKPATCGIPNAVPPIVLDAAG